MCPNMGRFEAAGGYKPPLLAAMGNLPPFFCGGNLRGGSFPETEEGEMAESAVHFEAAVAKGRESEIAQQLEAIGDNRLWAYLEDLEPGDVLKVAIDISVVEEGEG